MMNILIVDDDPDFRLLIARTLTRLGYETCDAINGIHAENAAFDKQADLVLLDFMMPFQDGYVTCRNLRRKGYTAPIIIMSALPHVLGTAESKLCGATSFLQKPVDFDKLRECLDSISSNITQLK